MSYARRGRGHGLMGLGAVADDQAPVKLGVLASTDPILSAASVMASSIMLRLAAVPKAKRLDEMVAIMNAGQPGLGPITRADYLRRAVTPDKKDQAMFDALRASIADVLMSRTLARASVSGLGQVSQGVQDANSLFCSYGAGTGAMVSGLLAQFNTGGSSSTAGITGAQTAGAIAGCNIPALQAQGQLALQQAQLAQSATAQSIALQQASDSRFLKYALAAGGLLGVLAVGAAILKK